MVHTWEMKIEKFMFVKIIICVVIVVENKGCNKKYDVRIDCQGKHYKTCGNKTKSGRIVLCGDCK